MKIIISLLITVSLILGIFAFSNGQHVNAQANIACDGISDATGNSKCSDTNDGSDTLQKAIKTGLNLLSIAAGIIAVVMLIIGGIRFITSQGEASSTASARSAVIYAIIGLVIVALSQIMVQFVIGRATTNPPAQTIEEPAQP